MAERRVGVLGGTFDPVHVGHLELAEAALQQSGLERVLFVPAGQPWRKADREITPVEHRVAMVQLAIEGHPPFQMCSVEVDRSGPSYTVETLERLREKLPGRELVLILGEDALADLPNWRDPEKIIGLASLAVARRRDGTNDENEALAGSVERLEWLEMTPLDLSSTEVRERVARGEPIRGLVPAAVEEYIREHGLYLRGRRRKRA